MMRVIAGLVGAVLLLACAHVTIVHTGGYELPQAWLTLAIAAGIAVGSIALGIAWAGGRRPLALCLAVAILAGEVFAVVGNAERLVTQREGAQAPVRAVFAQRDEFDARLRRLQAERTALTSPRVASADAALKAANQAVADKAAEKSCAANCRALLEEQVKRAREDVKEARSELAALEGKKDAEIMDAQAARAAWKMPASGSPLADRLGWSPWVLDLLMAGLMSVSANGLGAGLLAFAGHGHRRSQNEVVALTAQSKDAVKTMERPLGPQTLEPASKVLSLPQSVAEPVRTTGGVSQFCNEMFEFDQDEFVEQDEVVAMYARWCQTKKLRPVPADMFEQAFELVCEKVAIERGRHGDRLFVLGVALRPLPRARRKRA